MSTAPRFPFADLLHSPLELARTLGHDAKDGAESEAVGEICSQARRYCSKHVDSGAIDARGALGAELLDDARRLGWFGLTIPEVYGGAGLSMKGAARVVVELTAGNGSLGTCVGLHSGLALYCLIHLANPALRERYLPEVAAGLRIASFAATEPSAGSDLTAMRTTLREQDGRLLLSGSKCYVTNGGICGLVTVVAKSPGLGGARAGHTAVAVDPAWPGVTRQREEKKLGLKGSSTLTIDFDDVQVPHDHILGEPSKGMEHAHRALTWGRTFMAAGCLGAAQAALCEARAHTAERVQFGKPLAQLPLVRQQTVVALADVFASETVIRLVCDLEDRLAADIALPSTVAKIYGSEASWNVVDRSLQLMGGTGYMEEAGVARRLRDVRVTRIFEGANDVLRLHLGSSVLSFKSDELIRLPALSCHVPTAIAPHAARFDEVMAELGGRLSDIRAKYAYRLFSQQSLQSKMADAMVMAYVWLAVLLRWWGGLDTGPQDAREAALAELASRRLHTQTRRALARLADPEAPDVEPLAARVLGE